MSKQASKVFQSENEITWENVGEGIQRQVFGYDDKVMLVKAKFEKGAIGTLHSHPHSQVTYIRGGAFEVTIGDKTTTLKDGDGFYAPPNVIHGVVCLEPGILVDAFSPAREDFL
jgi:quercetin dioxygenase-like cupin family protein